MLTFHKLPNKYRGRGKKIGVLFKMVHKVGEFPKDTLIGKRMECQSCKCWLGIKAKECTRCKSNKVKVLYSVETCRYTSGNCTVNRWGCSIHFKHYFSHGLTCVCDECM